MMRSNGRTCPDHCQFKPSANSRRTTLGYFVCLTSCVSLTQKKGLGLTTDHRSPRMGILKNPTALPTPLQKSLVCQQFPQT